MAKNDFNTTQFETENYPGEMFIKIQNETALIQGWPGYRTRSMRSGYDPLDTNFELAHIEGVIIRKLITGEVITTNPIYLIVMAFYGIVGAFPLFISIIETLQGKPSLFLMIPFLPQGLLGLSLLNNVYKSIKKLLSGNK